MGIFVQYEGTTPEGLSFQGCYVKLASFVADTGSLSNITLVGRFAVFLSRDARLSGKQRIGYTKLPVNVTVSTSADELNNYPHSVVEFLYEKYSVELLKEGYVVEQILEENQTAPPVPSIQTNESNENEQTNGSASLEETNALPESA
jgi:hypothetical protein